MTKVINFFRDVKSELYKVVWPSRQDTIRYTVTVILFSLAIALLLGAVDYGLLRLFEYLINRSN